MIVLVVIIIIIIIIIIWLSLFLAHPSERLIELLSLCFMHRPSCVNFLYFHLLLQNQWADFKQTWWGSSLREQGAKHKNTQNQFSSSLEPVDGFYPNMISAKFLGIILLEKDPKFFVCSGWGGGWLLLAKGRRDLNVLGNCIKCIDCYTRVIVVPPGALFLIVIIIIMIITILTSNIKGKVFIFYHC